MQSLPAPRRPTLAYAKPTTCHWCGGTLERIRNVYKGRDSERYYDAEKCLVRGEERQLRKLAALAGTVCMHWTATLAAVLSVAMLAFIITGGSRAWAQDRHEGHDKYHDNAYSTWMKPDKPGESCCNMKVMSEDGKYRVKGDCYPTDARLLHDPETRDLNWWALRDDGKWIAIPDIKVLRRTPNPDETGRSAHICESYGQIHCFREPSGVL